MINLLIVLRTFALNLFVIGTLMTSLLLSFNVRAQSVEQIHISGIVNARSPIHAGDCFLKNNENRGSFTDSLGYFSFKFPKTLLYDTLVISAIGFERKEIPLADIDFAQDTLHFYLDQQSVLLDAVLIESERISAENLVLKAIANMPNNFPNKRHQLEGLYRKVSTQDGEYTHLEEAAFILEDNSYRNLPLFVKIKTEQFRQTRDWGDIDSLHATIFEKMNREISQELNLSNNILYRIYESNAIRNYNKDNTYFNFKTMRRTIEDHYIFEVMDVSVVEGDTICKVAFAESVTPPPPKLASGRNYLKINLTDFAIVEVQFTKGFENQSLISQSKMTYQKIDGRYYPKYIRDISRRNINIGFDDEEYDIHTFWFDIVSVHGLKRLKTDEINDPNDSWSHKRKSASSEFWNSTYLIKKYPLEQNIRTDLEKHETLGEQFMQNDQN